MKTTLRIQQKGISMIEALLGLIIFAAVTLFVIQTQAEVSQDQKAKRIADNTANASEIFTNYLLANRQEMIDAMKDGTNAAQFCVVRVTNPTTGAGTVANNVAKHTCAVDYSFLKFKRVVPQGINEFNEQRQRITAIYRLVYDDFDNNPATPDTTDGTVEMIVGGATNGGQEQSADPQFNAKVASYLGFNGGVIPNDQTVAGCTYKKNSTNPADKQACGAGGWKVNLTDFMNNP